MDAVDVAEIHRALGRIEGKQDSILNTQSELKAAHSTLRKDIDDVRSKLNWYSGALAVIGFAAVFLKDKIIGVFA